MPVLLLALLSASVLVLHWRGRKVTGYVLARSVLVLFALLVMAIVALL